ncbi:hypothetical protein [Demequina sp.]|uniref:hypothetical protein n=1 Tax=Demequina sp. TaxID=2050685 RepID=UPI003D12D210
MTDTTTIRVSRVTHQRLMELSEATGKPLGSVLEDALEALINARFAERVSREYEALAADPEEWAAYLKEVDLPAGHDLPE